MKGVISFFGRIIKTSFIKNEVYNSVRYNSNLVKIIDNNELHLRRIVMCNYKQRNSLGTVKIIILFNFWEKENSFGLRKKDI